MTEARITCTCANIIIADLGLQMTKGSVSFIGETDARKSKDLMRAARAGGVTVHFVTRAQQIRQPTAVVGRPKRELSNLVSRVSPVQPVVSVPTTRPAAPVPVEVPALPVVDDIVEMMNSVMAENETPAKSRKKRP